ncbi:MAG: rhodanese-like domain-containing protein [Anaeromyxobacteraceae bacterium]
MKRLLAAALLLAAVSPAFAQEDVALELGDFASAIAPARGLGVPPGIYAQIAQRADAFLSGKAPAPHRGLFADEVKALLDRAASGGPGVFVMDIRTPDRFAKGHVPGAVNIVFETVAKPENLAKLPTDGTPVVIVCNSGHTASEVAPILAMLGYNAWVLKFGWMGWTASTTTAIGSATGVKSVLIGAGYPVAK